MKVVTYEGVVENGCIHLPANAMIPDKSKVYVVAPGLYESDVQRVAHLPSPRLVYSEQAKDFVKLVVNIEERADADIAAGDSEK